MRLRWSHFVIVARNFEAERELLAEKELLSERIRHTIRGLHTLAEALPAA
jgi:hypothetical protein